MILSHDTLENYIRVNFSLMYNHGIDTALTDAMIPWEREIHIALIEQEIEAERLRRIH